MPTLLIECHVEGLTVRKGDGLRVDLATGEVEVFRDDDAPALLRGRIPAVVQMGGLDTSMLFSARMKVCKALGIPVGTTEQIVDAIEKLRTLGVGGTDGR